MSKAENTISLYRINWLFFYTRDGLCLLRGTSWISCRPGFGPRTFQGDLCWTKWHWHRVLSLRHFVFPCQNHSTNVPFSFHLMLHLLRQTFEALEPCKKTMLFRKSGNTGYKSNFIWVVNAFAKCFILSACLEHGWLFRWTVEDIKTILSQISSFWACAWTNEISSKLWIVTNNYTKKSLRDTKHNARLLTHSPGSTTFVNSTDQHSYYSELELSMCKQRRRGGMQVELHPFLTTELCRCKWSD